MVNFRFGWCGHLWQGRFSSYPLDENYLWAAARHVELNPVRARLAERPEDYPWSSARAHLEGKDDILVKTLPLLEMVPDWESFLSAKHFQEDLQRMRCHKRTGRPLGDERFTTILEERLRRTLQRQKPGSKRKSS